MSFTPKYEVGQKIKIIKTPRAVYSWYMKPKIGDTYLINKVDHADPKLTYRIGVDSNPDAYSWLEEQNFIPYASIPGEDCIF